MKRNQAIKEIRNKLGNISGDNLREVVTDVYSKPFGNRYLRMELENRCRLGNLTTSVLRGIVREKVQD